MLTFYYAPQSRATRIYQLLDELGALDKVQVETVAIPRRDGSGERDPGNPHPDGKVPALTHNGEVISESPAIVLYLTDLFPEAGLGPLAGQPGRGPYLSWLAWYGNVVEPVIHFRLLGIEHPGLTATFRGFGELSERLATALTDQPYLLGADYSAADLLIASTFLWLPDATPENQSVRDWVARCADRPSVQRTAQHEANLISG